MVYSVFGVFFDGSVKLLYDGLHDEVFIEDVGLVVMVNSRWLFSTGELFYIFRCVRDGVPLDL